MNTQEVLDKIKKLLAVATNESATAGEAEAALNRAAHLQSTYGISDDAIRMFVNADNPQDIKIDAAAVKQKILLKTDRIGRWDTWICQAAAIASNCRIFTSKSQGGIVGYGLPVDLEVCYEFVTYLMNVSETLRKRYCIMNSVRYGSYEGKAWKDGFCQGVIVAAQKAKEAEIIKPPEVVQITNSNNALVVVNNRSLIAARNNAISTYARQNLRLTTGKSVSSKGGSSYYAGRATGESQKLNRTGLN